MIYRIIYLSAATELFPDDEIGNLLEISRHNNRDAGITGMMLYHDGSFFQVLEGDEPAVTALYARICRDPRNHRHTLLWQGTAAERAFPGWSMGFARIDKLAERHRDGTQSLNDVAASLQETVSDPVVKMQMRSFLHSFRDVDRVGQGDEDGDTGNAPRA